jgi:co-chaperonin GroES (HSP10)
LAETSQVTEPSIMATVIAVGPGKKDLGEMVEMRYSVGQLVIVSAQSGHPLLIDGMKADKTRYQVEFRFIEQDSVLGIVNL